MSSQSRGLYSGITGVTLFLLESSAIVETTRALDAIEVGVERALDYAMNLHHQQLGFHEGYTGVLYLLARRRHLLADWSYDDKISELIDRMSAPSALSSRWDVIGGASGAIHALLHCESVLRDGRSLNRAMALAAHVQTTAQPEIEGLTWPCMITSGVRPMTGYAHGPSGVAAALLSLYEVVPNVEYLETASEALRYEDAFFSASEENWTNPRDVGLVDFEDGEEKARALCESLARGSALRRGYAPGAVSWCYGAPGMIPPRLHYGWLCGDAASIGRAAMATRQIEKFLSVDPRFSLCHGQPGNLDVLLTAARLSNDSVLEARVRDLGDEACRSYLYEPWRWNSREKDGADEVNLMQGLAGFGYFALRLVDDSTPSLLYPYERPVVERPRVVLDKTRMTVNVASRCFPEITDPVFSRETVPFVRTGAPVVDAYIRILETILELEEPSRTKLIAATELSRARFRLMATEPELLAQKLSIAVCNACGDDWVDLPLRIDPRTKVFDANPSLPSSAGRDPAPVHAHVVLHMSAAGVRTIPISNSKIKLLELVRERGSARAVAKAIAGADITMQDIVVQATYSHLWSLLTTGILNVNLPGVVDAGSTTESAQR